VATATPKRRGPAKLATALSISAFRGSIAREEINVATVLALSWNPFRKSNASAAATNIARNGEVPIRFSISVLSSSTRETSVHSLRQVVKQYFDQRTRFGNHTANFT
jgi:hypothetical protein